MNGSGSAPGTPKVCATPTDRPATRSEHFLGRLDHTLGRIRVIGGNVIDMEAKLFGCPAKENVKGANPSEVFSDTVVGNQDRLLGEITTEISAIEITVARLREYT